MTNEEMAKAITEEAGGSYHDCLDWLNDGDVDELDKLNELVEEWMLAGCEYSV